tara:strand:+ start:520 stop:1017 length:498 start_codon:yes stop_codon:yes gene_type:complete
MSDIRNLLKGQDVENTTADQLHTIGGRVFLDQESVASLNDFANIAQAWRGVHALAYGGPIGGTDAVTTHQMQTDNVEAVLTPTGTQLHRVIAAQVANGGGAPMTADLLVGGVLVAQGLTINPAESAGFDLDASLVVGASTPLQVHLTSGSASDAVAKVASVLVGL